MKIEIFWIKYILIILRNFWLISPSVTINFSKMIANPSHQTWDEPPKIFVTKMLYLWLNFQNLFDQNPQSDFFRVWTSFMFVDKDLEKKQFLRQICNSALRVFIRNMILKIHFRKKQFLCQICKASNLKDFQKDF